MKNKVLLDIDGVIANFYSGFARHLNTYFNTDLDLESEPEDYNIHKWKHSLSKETVNNAIPHWISYNGYESMSIYPKAKEFTLKLMDKYEVYVVTARVGDFEIEQLGKSPNGIIDLIKADTIKWFEENGIPSNNLFFDHRKVDFCQEHNIPILIEDKRATVIDATKRGIKAILMSRGWNQELGGKDESLVVDDVYPADDYSEILESLEDFFDKT